MTEFPDWVTNEQCEQLARNGWFFFERGLRRLGGYAIMQDRPETATVLFPDLPGPTVMTMRGAIQRALAAPPTDKLDDLDCLNRAREAMHARMQELGNRPASNDALLRAASDAVSTLLGLDPRPGYSFVPAADLDVYEREYERLMAWTREKSE